MNAPEIASRRDRSLERSIRAGSGPLFLRSVARGPLWTKFLESAQTSLMLETILCPFGRAFIGKGRVGTHHRAISRNGLVLFMSREPLALMEGFFARLRLSIWHRAFLRRERAEPWGIILNAAIIESPRAADRAQNFLQASIGRAAESAGALSIELGGERMLNFLG